MQLSRCKRDRDNSAKLGSSFTHYVESAGTFLEPEEGRFDFGWLDAAIDLADKAGLRVILCTPSAAPPGWMGTDNHDGPITGTYGIMEQPGHVNWGRVNPQPAPGAVGLWIWQAFGSGCSPLGRCCHPLRGSEMYHEGIFGPDGATLSRAGREFVETTAAVRAVAAKLDRREIMPRASSARPTGIPWRHDVYWDLEIRPRTTEWGTWAHRNTLAQAVRSAGAPGT